MSCITQLLELKGKEEYLFVHDSVVIEGGGVFKDYEYLIVFTSHGHRCGYVALPSGIEFETDELQVHGGITFEDEHHAAKDLLVVPCNDTWIGFDAAHCDDSSCYATARKVFGDQNGRYDLIEEITKPIRDYPGMTHKTYDYMENECKYLIDQLIESQNAA